MRSEASIIKSLLTVVSDGSPLVRAEVAVGTYGVAELSYMPFYWTKL